MLARIADDFGKNVGLKEALVNLKDNDAAVRLLRRELNRYSAALDDYLGLFEVAYKMLETGNLDREAFFVSYAYRVNDAMKCSVVREKIRNNREFWQNFERLAKECAGWDEKQKLKMKQTRPS